MSHPALRHTLTRNSDSLVGVTYVPYTTVIEIDGAGGAFADSDVWTMPAGLLFKGFKILVTEAFDGVTPTLNVGTTADETAYVDSGGAAPVDLTAVAATSDPESAVVDLYLEATTTLRVNLGSGSTITAGKAYLIFEYLDFVKIADEGAQLSA